MTNSMLLKFLTVAATMLVGFVATPLHAQEQEQSAKAPCIRVVRDTEEGYIIALRAGCDLRQVVRQLPQVDPESGRTLPEQEQLRSIYAANQRRVSDGSAKVMAVGRGCVPTHAPPTDATPEELGICPKGIVNYFATDGQMAIPRSRVATWAERVESAAKSACHSLAASTSDPSKATKEVQDALAQCGKALPASIEGVAGTSPTAAPTEDNSARVKELTNQIGERNAAIAKLETVVASHASMELDNRRLAMRSQLLFPLGIALLALVLCNIATVTALWRRRKAIAQPPDRSVLDRQALAKAMAGLDKELGRKLTAMHQELQRQKSANSQMESAVARQVERLRQEHNDQLARRDEALVRLREDYEEKLQVAFAAQQRAEQRLSDYPGAAPEVIVSQPPPSTPIDDRELVQLRRQLAALEAAKGKHERKIVSLTNRLSMAKSRNAYLSSAVEGKAPRQSKSRRSPVAAQAPAGL